LPATADFIRHFHFFRRFRFSLFSLAITIIASFQDYFIFAILRHFSALALLRYATAFADSCRHFAALPPATALCQRCLIRQPLPSAYCQLPALALLLRDAFS